MAELLFLHPVLIVHTCVTRRSQSLKLRLRVALIIHRCLGCGFERFNRIAADDDFDLVLALPVLPARTSREVKAQQLEALLAEQEEQWVWSVVEAS